MPRKTKKEIEAEWENSRLRESGMTKEAYVKQVMFAQEVNEHTKFMDDVATVGWGSALLGKLKRGLK